jgi:hypothetical protein
MNLFISLMLFSILLYNRYIIKLTLQENSLIGFFFLQVMFERLCFTTSLTNKLALTLMVAYLPSAKIMDESYL